MNTALSLYAGLTMHPVLRLKHGLIPQPFHKKIINESKVTDLIFFSHSVVSSSFEIQGLG